MEPNIIVPRKKSVAIIYKIIGVIVFVLAGFLLLSIHGILLLGLPVQAVFTIVIFSLVLFILGFGLFTLQKWIIPLIIILPLFALIRGSSINAEQIIVQILLLAVGFWGWKNKDSFKGKFFHPIYTSAIFLVLIVSIVLQFTGTPVTSILGNLGQNNAVKNNVATSTQSILLSKITDEAIIDFLSKDAKSFTKPIVTSKNGSYTIDFGGEGIDNIMKILKADLDNDGREDAVVLSHGCGASCSYGVDVLLNKTNGIVRVDNSDFPLVAKGADVTVQNGLISVTLENLAGEVESRKTFKVDNNMLVISKDWKTYTNAKEGFSFKYPADYDLKTLPPSEQLTLEINNGKEYTDITLKALDTLWTKDNVFICETKPTTNGCSNFKVDGKFNIDGGIVARDISLGGSGGETERVMFVHNGVLFDIHQFKIDTKILVKDIAKTFKFADADSKLNSTNWKTYTNTQYGFVFQYPTSLGELTTLKDNSLALGKNGDARMVVYMPKVFINSTTGQPETFNDLMISYDSKGYTKATIAVGDVQSVVVSSPQIGNLVFVPLANNKILEIAGSPNDSTFNQIVSTFKFTSSITQKEEPFKVIYEGPIYDIYKGFVNVSGKFTENFSGIFSKNLCFYPDDVTKNKIPRPNGDTRTAWFCFENQVESKKLLSINESDYSGDSCEISGQATITISDYKLFVKEAEGSDMASLNSLITSKPLLSTKNCR